jgi:protein-S-isoprenylcysteine O-methyltransferase Ste14
VPAPVYRTGSILLLLVAFGSFGWAMGCFFTKPSGTNIRIRSIQVLGTAFAVADSVAVLRVQPPRTANIAFGWILYVCASGLFWAAVRATVRSPLSWAFSSDRPVHLVVAGPYRFVRHPFYTSYLLAWLAGVVTTAFTPLGISLVVMAYVFWKASEFEEGKFSKSQLADRYAAYKCKTARFIPLLF